MVLDSFDDLASRQPISRRGFLARTLFALGAAATVGCINTHTRVSRQKLEEQVKAAGGSTEDVGSINGDWSDAPDLGGDLYFINEVYRREVKPFFDRGKASEKHFVGQEIANMFAKPVLAKYIDQITYRREVVRGKTVDRVYIKFGEEFSHPLGFTRGWYSTDGAGTVSGTMSVKDSVVITSFDRSRRHGYLIAVPSLLARPFGAPAGSVDSIATTNDGAVRLYFFSKPDGGLCTPRGIIYRRGKAILLAPELREHFNGDDAIRFKVDSLDKLGLGNSRLNKERGLMRVAQEKYLGIEKDVKP